MQFKMSKYRLFFFIIVIIIFWSSIFIEILGITDSSYVGFSVDSRQNLYVGRSRYIEVFDKYGAKIRQFPSMTSQGYAFKVVDNNLVIATSTFIYTMNLDGEIIDKQEDRSARLINEFKGSAHDFTLDNETSYKSLSFLGYHIIIRYQGQNKDIVYRMPEKDYINQILRLFSVIIFIYIVASMFINNIRRDVKKE